MTRIGSFDIVRRGQYWFSSRPYFHSGPTSRGEDGQGKFKIVAGTLLEGELSLIHPIMGNIVIASTNRTVFFYYIGHPHLYRTIQHAVIQEVPEFTLLSFNRYFGNKFVGGGGGSAEMLLLPN